MPDLVLVLSAVAAATAVLTLALVAAVLARTGALLRRGDDDALERAVRAESAEARREAGEAARALRSEILAQMAELSRLQREQFDGFSQQLRTSTIDLGQRHETLQKSLDDRLHRSDEQLRLKLGEFEKRITEGSGALRQTVETQLGALREENAKKLDEMRATVDEKLQGTLEKRLGESFQLVGQQLEAVHKGLGEMQTLAAGVGDLKRVLSNVKARGTWGEVALGNLLEQTLTPDQYAANVAIREGSAERVEYAIRLPGRDPDGADVWLPIDAKFPVEDWERLQAGADAGDQDAVAQAGRALEARIRGQAGDIATKYIDPPRSTDFAILFLPTEGLYAEIVRRPGLTDELQRRFRVIVAGPTTFSALLNSLQMGFRTLAIEKRSSEVWQVLGAVKTEFGKFGGVLERVKQQLQRATNTIDQVAVRERAIQRRLRQVEALPAAEATRLLSLPELDDEEAEAEMVAADDD